MTGLGDPTGVDTYASARAISADGSVLIGQGSISGVGVGEAFRWTADQGFVGLGYLPGGSFSSNALDVSADGSVVVGESDAAVNSEAFRWTADGGMVGLGDLPGGSVSSSAMAVSADGSKVVGRSESESGREAFLWTPDNGMVGLGVLDGFVTSSAHSISADGSVVVGSSGRDNFDFPFLNQAFMWTADGGMVGLGYLPGTEKSSADAVSADGSVVVGTSGQSLSPEAFIWDATHGMRNLQDVLTDEFGLNLTGWTLNSVYDISDDGSVIVGSGRNPLGESEAWRAEIPEPSSVLLLVSGLISLFAYGRGKRRRAVNVLPSSG
ncbi:MAG: PEP-CTERM sorting domain-containing protein [Planctomycetes bacterium]|nr:PEP-CTERM sorting domain-containing protein [Planctomycetota bacterium]